MKYNYIITPSGNAFDLAGELMRHYDRVSAVLMQKTEPREIIVDEKGRAVTINAIGNVGIIGIDRDEAEEAKSNLEKQLKRINPDARLIAI